MRSLLERHVRRPRRSLPLVVAVAVGVLVAVITSLDGSEDAEAVQQNFNISIGDTVSNGVPSAGAGNIEGVGDTDVYSFTATAGQDVYFDGNALGSSVLVRWTVRDPSSNAIFQNNFITSDPGTGTWDLPASGTYTITVFSDSGVTGAYNFRITNVPAPEAFVYSMGSVASEEIEGAGYSDEYALNGIAAGQQLYFDGNPSGGSAGGLRWSLKQGSTFIFQNQFVTNDAGVQTLTAGGDYTIVVHGDFTSTGSYNFQVTTIPAPVSYAVSVGDTVSPGVPNAPDGGAGALAVKGERDLYTFTTAPGQKVYFDGNPNGGTTAGIRWTLNPPSGPPIFQNLLVTGDPGAFTLGAAGTYTITVAGDGPTTGNYNFKLLNVASADVFAITIPITVTPGSPGAGAGDLENPGSTDEYTFGGSIGQQIYFDGNVNGGSGGGLRWTLFDPTADAVFQNLLITSDAGTQTLLENGTYTLRVFGDGTTIGQYNFRLTYVPAPQNFNINIGDTVALNAPGPGAGEIPAPGALDRYTFFNASAGQNVFFDGIDTTGSGGTCALRWRLTDPLGGDIIFDSPICTDPAGGQHQLQEAGTYTIQVYGVGPETGTYSFGLSSIAPPTATPSPTNTVSPTTTSAPATATATSTQLPTNTPTPTATLTHTPTNTATSSPTQTTVAATATSTSTPTNTPTATPTETPEATATNTPIPTATETPEATATNTAIPTATETPEATATHTAIPTATETPEATATNTPIPTATETPEATATNTPIPTATETPEATATHTAIPTATATSAPEATATSTAQATATHTSIPTATSTIPAQGTPAVTRTAQVTRTAVSTRTVIATNTVGVTRTVVATRTTLPATPTQHAADGCLTFGQKVWLLVGIFRRWGAEAGTWRFGDRYDVNDDGRIDWRDAKAVIRAPLCSHPWHR